MSDGAEPSLVVEGPGPDSLVGVFEDDGDTAYLYLYDENVGILRHLHIYDRPPSRVISEDDVVLSALPRAPTARDGI